MTGKRLPLRDRFENSYIPEPNSGCWLWTASLDKKGYGAIWEPALGRPERAPIVAYRLFKGDIPAGLMIRHKCDTPACVNPEHLLTGTAQDNVDDAINRKRNVKGEGLWSAKLTEPKVLAIRASTQSAEALAKGYGVTSRTIHQIRSGRKWKHLVSPESRLLLAKKRLDIASKELSAAEAEFDAAQKVIEERDEYREEGWTAKPLV